MSRHWLVQSRPWLGRRVDALDFVLPVEDDDPPGPCTQALMLEQELQHRAECAREFDRSTNVLALLAVCLGVWGAVAYVIGSIK